MTVAFVGPLLALTIKSVEVLLLSSVRGIIPIGTSIIGSFLAVYWISILFGTIYFLIRKYALKKTVTDFEILTVAGGLVVFFTIASIIGLRAA